MSTLAYPVNRSVTPAPRRFLLRRIGLVLLWLLGALLVVVLALPIPLLFVATAVPLYLSVALAVIDVGLIASLFWFERSAILVGVMLLGVIVVSAMAVWLSQIYATTPLITDAQGQVLPGSIATLEKVKLGNSEQWVSIRGKDVNKPILLFLADGPGGSQLTTARHELAGLEDHFVLVNWEQPGAGKSFYAVDRSTLTPERYIGDGHELVLYLRQRFDKEKIYVLGESWGSALGIMLVQRYPELFYAHIGTAQMVAFLETDLICFDFAIDWAEQQGNPQRAAQLRTQGPPPYYGDGVAWKQVNYLRDTYTYMNQNPAIDTSFNTPRDLGSPEYGLLDIVNWARGPLDTLGIVYQQLWDIDFRKDAPKLAVPVYFLTGRHDVNAPPALIEEYYDLLVAPHKEIVWFERSGHSPWVSESEKFVDVMVNTVLAQTQKGQSVDND